VSKIICPIDEIPKFAEILANSAMQQPELWEFDTLFPSVNHILRPIKNLSDMIKNIGDECPKTKPLVERHETIPQVVRFDECYIAIAYCERCNRVWYGVKINPKYKRALTIDELNSVTSEMKD